MTGGLRIALAGGALVLAGSAGFVIGRSSAPSSSPSPSPPPPAAVAVDSAAPAVPAVQPAARTDDAGREYVCPDNPGSRSITYGAVRLETRRDEMDACGFTLFGPDGAVLAQDEGPVIVLAQYADLDADRRPELLVVAESGGSLGLNDSILVTQGSAVRVIEMPGGASPAIESAPDGDGLVLTMLDQSFAVVELMCNACAPRPRMFYRLEDGALQLRNSRYLAFYDRHIRELEAELTSEERDEFLKAAPDDQGAVNDSIAAQVVLRVAVDYAASGREADAMRVLEERWPAWDRDRVSELVRDHVIGP